MNDHNNSSQPATDLPLLDPVELMTRIGGNVDLLQRLVPMFTTSSNEYLDAVMEAVGQQDIATIEAKAHSLKGSAANLGCLRTANMAMQLETCASNKQFSDAGVLVEQIREQLIEVESELNKLTEDTQ